MSYDFLQHLNSSSQEFAPIPRIISRMDGWMNGEIENYKGKTFPLTL